MSMIGTPTRDYVSALLGIGEMLEQNLLGIGYCVDVEIKFKKVM